MADKLKINDLTNGVELIFPDGITEKIQFYSTGTVRCSKSKIPIRESLVVKKDPEKINFSKSEETSNSITLTTEKLKVVVSKSEGKVSFFKPDSTVLIEECFPGEFEKITVKGDEGYSVKQKFSLKSDGLYGLGQNQENYMNYKNKKILLCQSNTLEQALCLRNIPSQLYEKINRPQVEVKESLELVNKPVIISRNEGEKVEIESSANSVRVNVAIKKHAEIEKLIVGIYSNYLMNRANQLNILRKVAKPGYDISFLITNFTLENYKKEDIIDFIIEFIQDFVKEVTDMKMTVNSQSRYATTYLMEHVKV